MTDFIRVSYFSYITPVVFQYSPLMTFLNLDDVRLYGPGVVLCTLVAVAAVLAQEVEVAALGRPWLEALVLAILMGTGLRTVGPMGGRWQKGITFCGRTLLEIAIVLLGASLSFASIVAVGPVLLLGIVVIVGVALAASYGICRMLGLPWRMAVLVACGNSICGNSAIAAVAPVIGADSDDVATSIAFTAVLGIIVVLALPVLVPLAGLGASQYGIVAGLTVYAIPQVLAATAPVALASVQMGTLVKLMRVLMLGPVIVAVAMLFKPDAPRMRAHGFNRLVPWYILGFLGMSGLRSAGVIPMAWIASLALVASMLTVLSMAALGLGVDVRKVMDAGGRVVMAVTLSIMLLALLSVGFVLQMPPVHGH